MFLLISWIAINSKGNLKSQIPVLLAFLALLIGQFFYYQNTFLAFSFWLFLGLGAISWRGVVKEKSFNFKDFPELGLLLTIIYWTVLFGFLFSYFIMAKFYLADVYYKQYLMNPTEWELSGDGNAPLEKAVRIANSRTVYHIVLARAYLQKFSQESAKFEPDNQILANMTALAVREGRRAVELSPHRVGAQETLGFVYRDIQGVAQGASDWGIKMFEKAIELEPKNPILLTELAKLYVVNNNLEKAKELLNKALTMKGDYADAVISMSILEESEGKIGEAAKRLENLVNKNPFSIEGHFQLGRLYYNRGEHDQAIEQFQLAIQLFPNHSNSLYSLGLIYEKRGNKEKALEMFRKVLELNPESEEVKNKIKELSEKREEKVEEILR
jgi:Flp pilus assembly protein TadD